MLDWMTPDYASPEQLRAERVTVRSDVYSLGVVLYELLTGQRPYSFKNQPKDQPRYEIARAICEQEPERPSARVQRIGVDTSNFSGGDAVRLHRRLTGDLDRIVLKALAKEPERRYQSVAELSEDIRRHLIGRPVVARGDSLSYRAGKLMRRHKAMTAVLAGCLIAGLIVLAWRAVTAPERRLARRRANHAAQIEQSAAGLAAKEFDAYEQALQRCLPQPGEEDLRGFEWHYLRRLGHRALLTLRHRSPVYGPSFVSGGRIFTGGRDYTYKLWDEATGRELAVWKLSGESSGALTPDPHGQADRLVLVENGNSVKVWDLATGQLLHDLTDPAGGDITANLLPDRQTLVTGHQDGSVKLRDAATGRPLFTLRGLPRQVTLMNFSANGRRMLTNIANTHVQIWDWPGRRVIATFRESVGSWFRFTPNGRWFWTLVGRKVTLRESAGGGTVGTIEERDGKIENGRMLDEWRLAICLSTGKVKIYELPSLKLLAVFERERNSAPVFGVALSPDGRLLVTSNIDGEITVWDVAARRELTTINGHAKETYSLAFSPDGRKLISGSEDGTAKVWDVAAISEPDNLSGHRGQVFSVAFSPDGQRLATASFDRTIKLWDVKTGETLRTFTGHEDQILCVTFSPDGKRIASSGSDGAARVWDVATSRSLLTLKHSWQIHSVAFSPDGRWLATAGSDHEVRIWDAATGQEARRLTGHGDEVWTVAFSPNGATLTVNSAADTNNPNDGVLTLREAILISNGARSAGASEAGQVFGTPGNGLDNIVFALGAGTPSINVGSSGLGALPTITNPVFINGNTGGATRVELNGAAAGAVNGLTVAAGNSRIKSLVINRFTDPAFYSAGIRLQTGGANTIEDCHLGTNASGTAALGNVMGLHIDSSSSTNIIGGAAAGKRNLIAGNATTGLFISNGAKNNRIEGNYIGTDINGTADLGNGQQGVHVDGSTTANNVIGGATAAARNVISGNTLNGVAITGGANGTRVEGNYIGTNASGSAAIGNTEDGVYVSNNSAFSGSFNTTNNVIGGVAAGARNILSGNEQRGILITNGANGNRVEGNFIGTDANGTASVPNNDGINITTNAANNVIGGTTAAARNVISGNNVGGVAMGSGANNNRAEGNYIGVNVAGTTALGNSFGGVSIYGLGTTNNVIGGTAAGARNIISGNILDGVSIVNVARGNRIEGNYIGTDAAGAVAISNGQNGVRISGGGTGNNVIGGTAAGARNVISANQGNGVAINSAAAGNRVEGNYIGLNATGAAALGNEGNGVDLSDDAANNTIGGTVVGARNVISGNGDYGLGIFGADGNLVLGNYIGTDVTGTVDLGNALYGVIINDASNNTIGGTTAAARNLISGNDASGIGLVDTTGTGVGVTNNKVLGNYIGADVSGTASLGNSRGGVLVTGADNKIVRSAQ